MDGALYLLFTCLRSSCARRMPELAVIQWSMIRTPAVAGRRPVSDPDDLGKTDWLRLKMKPGNQQAAQSSGHTTR